ncbi:hypothetical protein SELSPUOL_02027 [Selenomonas sputigena ATCC 35185]|uniref:Uncharacterized protein n=1 Tax=Selenomonas sputigena (strain ATCC 35185 / DSM 20758 / CCUG 44933 / VPI D19B-28) TaxID=546271 RepID=C9LX20_SELS3|nr:hypothetical protein SELSPUOL_02027 [Selenomonas sputigena ATCC 35185]
MRFCKEKESHPALFFFAYHRALQALHYLVAQIFFLCYNIKP